MESEKKTYENLKEYKEKLLNDLIELDTLYTKQELKALDTNAIDANKLANLHNLRKSNLTLLLRIDLIGNESTIEIQDNK